MQRYLTRTAAVLRNRRSDDGQDLLEYALLVSLIVITALGAVDLLGTTIKTALWDVIAATEF
jgi:Flp pilus assembly pilin Flp